ncbi:hypothetical protein EDB92DRAFT_1817071 [Lactarius akahatsu]|uniref:Uncharacterized protein n=1 Tax=Lactarius akahatsu TaxID=416441 RepID=A0AAD4LIB7_9AGAM|nr:hypothetical protein EDB92DRAFT_1817071 [Lactarius akahatsu]
MVEGAWPYCVGPYTYLLDCSILHGRLDGCLTVNGKCGKKGSDETYLGPGLLRIRAESLLRAGQGTDPGELGPELDARPIGRRCPRYPASNDSGEEEGGGRWGRKQRAGLALAPLAVWLAVHVGQWLLYQSKLVDGAEDGRVSGSEKLTASFGGVVPLPASELGNGGNGSADGCSHGVGCYCSYVAVEEPAINVRTLVVMGQKNSDNVVDLTALNVLAATASWSAPVPVSSRLKFKFKLGRPSDCQYYCTLRSTVTKFLHDYISATACKPEFK